jgi:hypothetical protein
MRVDGKITSVDAPNGEDSLLYKNLLSILGEEEKALEYFAISYTPEFTTIHNNVQKDANGEYYAQTVLDYVQNSSAKQGLSSKEIVEVQNSVLGLPITSLSQLSTLLKTAFISNGVFKPTKQSLIASKLYTNSEIDVIITTPTLREQIYNVIKKLDRTPNIQFSPSLEVLSTTDSVSPIGKTTHLNPYLVEKELENYLIGVTEEQFSDVVQTLPFQSIIDKYNSDATYAKSLYEKYSKLQKVPYLINEKQVVDSTRNLLESVLKTGMSNAMIIKHFNTLLRISPEVWDAYPKEVATILEDISKESLLMGINLSDLVEVQESKTQPQTLEFLNALVEFTTNLSVAPTSEDVDNFSQIYDEYFSISPVEKTKVIETSDLSLVVNKTTESAIETFEISSLLQVKDDVYQLIDRIPQEELFNELMVMVEEDPSILPDVAYYPTAYDGTNTFRPNKAKNAGEDVKRYLNEKASLNNITPEMVIYKLLFGHPLSSTQNKVDVKQEFNNYSEFTGDVTYLTGEFISDFYQRMVGNDILSKAFEIENGEIVLKNNDPITIAEIKTVSDLNDLKNYSIINKNLENIFEPKEIAASPTTPFLRSFYVNNPKLVREYKGKFSGTIGSPIINIENIQDDFVRLDGRVYEKIETTANIAHYTPLVGINDSTYNVIDKNVSVNEDYSAKDATLKSSAFSSFKSTPLYTETERQNIEQTIDHCG